MGKPDLDLPALIGSRICHDLISPIGAINNGLELLTMGGGGAMTGPELDLIGQSVGSASARIRFFRIAFGAAGTQSMGAAEVTSILRDLFAETRFDVQWQIATPQARENVRLLFLALMCVETALHHGGQIALREEDGQFALQASADKVAIDPELWELLSDPSKAPKLQPAQVQFALLPLLAGESGRSITVTAEETLLTLQF